MPNGRNYRKIEFNGEPWEVKFGNSNAHIRDPNGKGYVVDYSTLTGRSWHTFERGQYKKTCDGMVSTGHVIKYIAELKAKSA